MSHVTDIETLQAPQDGFHLLLIQLEFQIMNGDRNERGSLLPPFIIESCCKPEVNTKLKPMSSMPQRLAVPLRPPLALPPTAFTAP